MEPQSKVPPFGGVSHEELLGGLHDVSNALTVLLGWVEEARDPDATRETIEHALTMIERRGRAARDLARQIIGARVDSEPVGELPLEEVLAEVVGELSVEAEHAHVRIETRRAFGLARVIEPSALSQVLTNMLMNAIAFSPRGGAVTVEALGSDDTVAVSFTDEGEGIAPSRAQAIFDGDSTRPGGAGVGLRHARAVARRVGGDVELMPKAPGKGATFRVLWPRTEVLAIPPPLSSRRMPVLAGRRILVLEDDVDVALLLETALGARGAEVTIAKNVKELREASRSLHDSALIDLSPILGDVEGALATVRMGSPDVALVLISGSSIGVPNAPSLEGVRWVRKPFEVAEVVAALLEPRRNALA